MVTYKEITTVADRKPVYIERRVVLPILTKAIPGSAEHEEWVKNNWWMVDYAVNMDDKKEAVMLAWDLQGIFSENPRHPSIPGIVEKLKRMRVKHMYQMTIRETWGRSARQMVGYAGEPEVAHEIRRKLGHYSGTILEAMCGHESYFEDSSARTVVALDYCVPSLERYPYPHRRRIECDLNQVRGKRSLSFFENGQFDAISVCFGFKYPEYMGCLVREFRRILKPGGVLSFIENPNSSYEWLCIRRFSRMKAAKVLLKNGYGPVRVNTLHVPGWQRERGRFYHVEAVKCP